MFRYNYKNFLSALIFFIYLMHMYVYKANTFTLKMLGLYLYTLIIGHKSCNMKGILNKITLQKKLQHFVTNYVFWDEKKSTTKTKYANKKTHARAGNWTRDLSHTSGVVTPAPPSQLRIMIVVKLINYFVAMDRNVNIQGRICGPHIFNTWNCFCNILHAWVTIFGSFSYLRE